MKTVLVVDDEPFVSEVIEMALQEAGYRVISAANGVEGLKRISEELPDIIIVDRMMPLLDGPGMVQQVRQNPAHADIPVVLISAIPCSSLDSLCPGAHRFLLKPFSLEDIVRLIDELGESL